jgi:hypothetical protein
VKSAIVTLHLEDLHPAVAVRRLDRDSAVESSRAEQRGVKDLGAVRRPEHDHGLFRLKAVHLGQDLVERLLPLVVRARYPGRALARAADGVELIDENDRRCRFLCLGEQIAHSRRAHADDRLDELRRRDREKRGVSLSGDGAR